jgi:serine/threonine protein kinase/Tol biopolymer transport system component
MVGTRLAHYEILATLGAGGMGVVYKARDTRLNRLAAIKILKSTTADENLRRRFSQEAQAASALNHPGIITIYDIARDRDVDFIAMEFVQGKTLEELIARKALPLPDALGYAIQVARALAKAHTEGIVHRDLKPSNIMVTADGLAKILDFGVAKLTGLPAVEVDADSATVTRTIASMKAALTNDGRIVGTIAYMSPEQASGQKVDTRSDIFSFGCVLYEMVTGTRAFAGDSSMSTLAAVVNQEPKPPSEVNARIPRDLERIVARCLRKDPARRFQHLDDVAVELEEVRVESGTHAAGIPASAPRRQKTLAIAATAVAVIAGVLWATRPSPEAPLPTPSISKLTSFPGDEAFPALSPDGSQVAFAWNGERRENADIYIKRLDADTPLRLTTDPAQDIAPAWSPDGSRLAFVRGTEGLASIYLTAPVPGAERKLADYTPSSLGYPSFPTRAHSPAWTPDGRAILVAARTSGERPNAILAFPVDGGEARTVVSLAKESGVFHFPAVSPDGSLLAYTLCTKGCDIYIQELGPSLVAREEPRRLTNQNGPPMYGVTWAADGKSIVYGSYIGSFNVWRAWIADRRPERMDLGIGAMRPHIARTGNRLAFVSIGSDSDIWRFEAGVGPTPVVSSNLFDLDPHLSPDGKRIAMSSERSGKGREIWIANVHGGGAVRITDSNGKAQGMPRWSPDGRWIAYDVFEESGEYGINVIEAAGGSPRPLAARAAVPSWSRDGKWIYFRSNRGGRNEIWRIAAAGGTPEQITQTGGIAAWESWNGELLYYSRGGSLYSQPVTGGPEREVLTSVLNWEFFPTKTGIFHVVRPDARRRDYEIRYLAFATGRIETLYRFESLGLTRGLSVSEDEKTIILGGISPSKNADLMLMENFR